MKIIHTGQHYDKELSEAIFNEFGLPAPDINLGVGSGSHGAQTGTAMARLEAELAREPPDITMVVGDTNSTLAGVLVSAKQHIPSVHLEAGARVYDLRVAEEVNRVVADHVSSLLLTPCKMFGRNLVTEGLNPLRIVQSGDTMYDTLLGHREMISKSRITDELGLDAGSYILLTTHRAENVDNPRTLTSIVSALSKLTPMKVVFPVHPRTRQMLRRFALLPRLEKSKHILMIAPQGYADTLRLVSRAKLVMTDSGGLQKESFWLRVPCATLRDRTEWVDTVTAGANILVGNVASRIVKKTQELIRKGRVLSGRPPNIFGDGHAGEKVVKAILDRKGWLEKSWLDYSKTPWRKLLGTM